MTLFAKSEYLERLNRTKDRMEKAGLEVLVVTDPANMNYLTGYDAISYYVEQAVVVSLEDDEPFWFSRRMDTACARFTTWLSPQNLVGYPEDLVQTRLKHPMQFLASVMKERGLGAKPIGLEMDAPHFTPRSYEVLVGSLPDATFDDARLLVSWVRGVKSPAEIALMRKAGQIMKRVMETAVDQIRVGARECDVAAAILHTQAAGTQEFGGDMPSFPPLICPGEKASAPHLTWTDDRFSDEMSINLELAACVKRYHCPLSRTMYLGKKPPKRLTDTAKWTIDGLTAELAAIRPGVTCEEVDQAWRRAIAHTGIKKESRSGYAMGLGYAPDWGEHTCCMRPGDRTVLRPGMTFHIITGIWMDTWGFEISESVAVTETGHELLTDVPRELIIKG
ncbi:MAG TPA: Xaa-Pro peptidase family protein [Anaerolineae bacterium]|nr:Xaa-Pro peptidase family protein [Anaerolineae bacterium]